jgi:hypothetical protein
MVALQEQRPLRHELPFACRLSMPAASVWLCHGVWSVVVYGTKLRRFQVAAEPVVQELGIALPAKRGVRLLTVSGDDHGLW